MLDPVWIPAIVAGSGAVGGMVASFGKALTDIALGRTKATTSQLAVAMAMIAASNKRICKLEDDLEETQDDLHAAQDALQTERELRAKERTELLDQIDATQLALTSDLDKIRQQRDELEIEVGLLVEQVGALSRQLEGVGLVPASKRARNEKGQFA